MKRPQTKTLVRLGAAIVVIAAATVGVLVWHHKSGPYHFLAVTDGKLYRSGTLSPLHLREVLDRHDIKTVVNLRSPSENALGDWHAREEGICREKGIDLVELPLDEPPATESIGKWLSILDAPERLPVLVHCEHGGVRTGIMVAIYEMEYLRKDNDATLRDLPLFGHDFEDPSRQRIKDYLLRYVPRWKKEPAFREQSR